MELIKLYSLPSISESKLLNLNPLTFLLLIKNFFFESIFYTSLSIFGILGVLLIIGYGDLIYYITGDGNLFSLLPNYKKSKFIFLSKSFLTSVKSLKCFSYYNNYRIKF